MKYIIIAVVIIVGVLIPTYHNVDDIKLHAEETWSRAGYTIVGYVGYQGGHFDTWGGQVWYTVRTEPDNGIIYTGGITKWGDEYHIYALSAIDAIKP